jgi:hypothetical protein
MWTLFNLTQTGLVPVTDFFEHGAELSAALSNVDIVSLKYCQVVKNNTVAWSSLVT